MVCVVWGGWGAGCMCVCVWCEGCVWVCVCGVRVCVCGRTISVMMRSTQLLPVKGRAHSDTIL